MSENIHQSFRMLNQEAVAQDNVDWHRKVLLDLSDRLQPDSDFPCMFSKRAFAKNLLRFIFVEGVCDSDIKHLSEGLSEFVRLSNHWNGSMTTAYPLIIAFSLNAISSGTVERYDTFGWSILQRLHEADPSPWPTEVGVDPNSASWSMCFDGMPLFFNMSHPAHLKRRSRNLGEHF